MKMTMNMPTEYTYARARLSALRSSPRIRSASAAWRDPSFTPRAGVEDHEAQVTLGETFSRVTFEIMLLDEFMKKRFVTYLTSSLKEWLT